MDLIVINYDIITLYQVLSYTVFNFVFRKMSIVRDYGCVNKQLSNLTSYSLRWYGFIYIYIYICLCIIFVYNVNADWMEEIFITF